MSTAIRRRWMVALLAMALGVAMAGCEEPSSPAAPSPPADPARYAEALAVADAFCHAWRTGDEQAARALLSPALLAALTERQIADGIAGTGNPLHAAYEIHDGRWLSEDRCDFPIRLFYHFRGGHGDRTESPLDRLVVGRNAAGQWKVKAFPFPPVRPSVRQDRGDLDRSAAGG